MHRPNARVFHTTPEDVELKAIARAGQTAHDADRFPELPGNEMTNALIDLLARVRLKLSRSEGI
jgi:hypothetical protein